MIGTRTAATMIPAPIDFLGGGEVGLTEDKSKPFHYKCTNISTYIYRPTDLCRPANQPAHVCQPAYIGQPINLLT